MTENVNVNAAPAEGVGEQQTPEVRQPDGSKRFANPTEARLYREAMEKAGVKAAGEKGEPGGEEMQPQDQDQQDSDTQAELSVPEETPHEHIEKLEGFMADLTPITRELNIPTSEVQDVVDLAVSLAVMDRSGVNLEDPDACKQVLQNQYGKAEADKIITDARAAAQRLGPKMLEWLDDTALGSDPSVLYALAAWKRGDLKMSASKAQAELDKLKGEELRTSAWKNAHHPGHKAAVARANLLYAIAAKGEARAEARKAAEPSRPRAKSAGESRNAQLDAQIKALNADPDMRRRDSPRHKELAAKARELYELRYGSEKHEA
jgi:hypothetical protein